MYLYIYIYLHFSPQPLQLKRSWAKMSRLQHQVSRYRPSFYAATGVQDFLCVDGGVKHGTKKVPGQQVLSGMDLFIIHTYIVPTICSKCVCVIEFRCFAEVVHMALTCMSFATCANSSISLAPLAVCESLLSESNCETGQNHESSWLLAPSYLPKSNLWCEMMWWCGHFSVDVIWCYCTSFPADFQQLTITTLEDILCSHSLRSFFLPFNASWNVGDWMWCNRRSFDQECGAIQVIHPATLQYNIVENWIGLLSFPRGQTEISLAIHLSDFPIVFVQPSMSSQEISVVMPSACMSLASTQGSDLTPRLSKGCAPLTQPHPARRSPGMRSALGHCSCITYMEEICLDMDHSTMRKLHIHNQNPSRITIISSEIHCFLLRAACFQEPNLLMVSLMFVLRPGTHKTASTLMCGNAGEAHQESSEEIWCWFMVKSCKIHS